MRGLGRVTDVLSQALFPVPAEALQGLDPRTVKAMQRQGLMQLGLGMLAAKEQGAGLGAGLNFAFNQAQQDINQGLGQALISRRANREDERLEMYDRRMRNAELQQDADRTQDQINRMRGEARYKEGLARDDLARVEEKRRHEERMAIERRGTRNPVNQQIMTRPTEGGLVQDFAFNPETLQRTPVGDPYKPVTTHTGNPTEGERVAGNFAARMSAAEEKIGNYQPSVKDYFAMDTVMRGGPLTASLANKTASEPAQSFYQAASDWVRAKLRKESGAVIPPDEMAQEIKIYFPMPGEGPEIIEQKRQARAQAEAGMKSMAGRSVIPLDTGGELTATGPNGQKLVLRNGQWVPM